MWGPNQRFCIMDYETRSEAPLKKTGAYEYARHPSTRIMCVSWRTGTRAELKEQLEKKIPAKIWSPAFPAHNDSPFELAKFISNPDIILVAHNALFEQVITAFVFNEFRFLPVTLAAKLFFPERWACTASFAAACALPRHLDGVGMALNLPVKKDKEGHRLMLKHCKPRKPTKNNPNKWHDSARELRRIMQYCQVDVDAETWLFLSIPPLSEKERELWLLDQKINLRGFKADRDLVEKALHMIKEETGKLNSETNDMTLGQLVSTTQRDGVLEWLESEGVFLPNLQAKTVSDAIKTGLVDGEAKRMLEIRQAISKTSTKKYSAFELRSRSDGRVRDILVYHTASTGRWGGAGVQPQNFPTGGGLDMILASEILKHGDLELVRLLYGNPMNIFSGCLRSVIEAPEGKELYCGDWAAIEARVVFWLAKHESGIRAFRENRPMYEEMAAIIFNIDHIENVDKQQRQVGKQAVLGCGFGMGWKKFIQTCKKYGIEVTEEVAKAAVNAFRSTHSPIPKLWSNYERAAIAAVRSPGKKFKINYTTWWTYKNFLWCELPSGRRLAYYGPAIKYELTPWGEKKPVLYHFGVDSYSKKWVFDSTYGGKLTENVTQAVARDIMAEAMLRVEKAGYEVVLSVHDELLNEKNLGEGSLEEYTSLLSQSPQWTDCPIKVESWKGPRYKK